MKDEKANKDRIEAPTAQQVPQESPTQEMPMMQLTPMPQDMTMMQQMPQQQMMPLQQVMPPANIICCPLLMGKHCPIVSEQVMGMQHAMPMQYVQSPYCSNTYMPMHNLPSQCMQTPYMGDIMMDRQY